MFSFRCCCECVRRLSVSLSHSLLPRGEVLTAHSLRLVVGVTLLLSRSLSYREGKMDSNSALSLSCGWWCSLLPFSSSCLSSLCVCTCLCGSTLCLISESCSMSVFSSVEIERGLALSSSSEFSVSNERERELSSCSVNTRSQREAFLRKWLST